MSVTERLMCLFSRRPRTAAAHPGRRRFLRPSAAVLAFAALCLTAAPRGIAGEESHGKRKWVATWAASPHGSYPVGTAIAQPILTFAFPSPQTGADDQTFRLIVRPDLWGDTFRLRFSNVFGTQPVTIDGVYAGLQANSAALVPGSNRPVTFSGMDRITIPAGELEYGDP